LLHPVLKPTLDVRTGTIYADLSLTGTVGSPQLGGQARVYNGSLYLPDISQTITDINGQFLFDRNTINIGKVSGRSGGGEVSAWGRVFLDGLGLVKDLGLTIRTSSVEFRLANDVAAIGSGELDLRWATGKIVSVAGTMLVDEALVASEFGGEGGGGPKVNGDSLTLDLKLTADRNIWFRNRLTDLELAGELAVRINRQGLFVLGQLASRQGRVYAFDHTFRVTEGVLRFDNPTRVDPGLDITAELPSRIRGLRTGDTSSAKILLNLTGVASRPILTLGSDPAGISETDIGSYLATNITREELNQRMDRETFNHLVSDRLLNLASREVTSRLQRYLELDVLELKTPSLTSGAGLKITVGKYVGKNLFFSYTANTTQLAPEEFKVEYFITSGQEVVGARTETGAYSLKWQLKFRY
jgi:translocation and assembly module TamB